MQPDRTPAHVPTADELSEGHEFPTPDASFAEQIAASVRRLGSLTHAATNSALEPDEKIFYHGDRSNLTDDVKGKIINVDKFAA